MFACRCNEIRSRIILQNCIRRDCNETIIASNLGYDISIQQLEECYTDGVVSKEDFAAALRAHQDAVDVRISPQREAAAKFIAAQGSI
eukprot:scaffold9984_cov148-Skeletonema_dohrnii-CCMP3373.AAC.11